MTSRNLLVARHAQYHPVVKLGLATVGVPTNVMCVKWTVGKVAGAALTLTVSSDEELPDLARSEETARIDAASHGLLRVSTESARVLANGPDTSC